MRIIKAEWWPYTFTSNPANTCWLLRQWTWQGQRPQSVVENLILITSTVRDWEARFAPLIADQLRAKRHGQAGTSWYVDETYVSVLGKWCYIVPSIGIATWLTRS